MRPPTTSVFAALLFAVLIVAAPTAVLADDMHPMAQEIAQKLGDDVTSFVLVVEMKAAPGKAEEFVQTFQEALTETRKEEGNIAYDLSQDVENPEAFLLYEEWRSVADLDSHLKQPYLTKLLTTMEAVRDGAPVLRILVRKGAE